MWRSNCPKHQIKTKFFGKQSAKVWQSGAPTCEVVAKEERDPWATLFNTAVAKACHVVSRHAFWLQSRRYSRAGSDRGREPQVSGYTQDPESLGFRV